jgi:hypothetical protein
MPFPKTPALENQIVLCNLGQRTFKSAPGHGRKDDIIESSARRDRFDRAAARSAKETREWNRNHPLHPTMLVGWNSQPTLLPQISCRGPLLRETLRIAQMSVLCVRTRIGSAVEGPGVRLAPIQKIPAITRPSTRWFDTTTLLA